MHIDMLSNKVSLWIFSGTPSEIFYFGLQWFVVVLTFPVASIIISLFILPVFYRLELTSVYEVRIHYGAARRVSIQVFGVHREILIS